MSIMLSQVDHDVLLRLAKILDSIEDNPLIRGFPIFFPLVILWFLTITIAPQPDDDRTTRHLLSRFVAMGRCFVSSARPA